MGGFFGVASKNDCVSDLFFGVDYHSHLGTKRGGMAVCGKKGFDRAIHNIENSPFRTKFENDINAMEGRMGIGCISDNEPQPLLFRSHLGSFAIATVGRINNAEELAALAMKDKSAYFSEMSGGIINATELVASLINRMDTPAEGIAYASEMIEGSMSILLLSHDALYAARDRLGRTPVTIGGKDGAFCASLECFSYINLGYADYKELGPGEIVKITPDGCETVRPAGGEMKICSFLWVYYGYPSSTYEGVNVEEMRYRCGSALAARDKAQSGVVADTVAGIPDSGTAHAIGYATASGAPFSRPFIKYTPTWQRSFTTQSRVQREATAKMKLLSIEKLIKDKRVLLVEDSIVRGTQLREPASYLFQSGANEVHIRVSCPPILYNCPFLHFTRSTPETDLVTRRIIAGREGPSATESLNAYADPDSRQYCDMIECIRNELRVSSLKFQRLEDMTAAIGLPPCKLCTYCWNKRG